MAIEFRPATPDEKAKGIIATAPVKAGTVIQPEELREAVTKLTTPPKGPTVVLTVTRGRPKTGKAKKAVTIRLDQDVVEALQARDEWRSEVNEVLRRHLGI